MPRSSRSHALSLAAIPIAVALSHASTAQAQRLLGLDVADWQDQNNQGPIDWTTVHKPTSQGGGGKDFAFIRSSRGGTVGFYDEHDSANKNGLNTGAQRYDDYAFKTNITSAVDVGMLAGAYHFARADIITYQWNGQTVTHTGVDEANHFLQQAGPWMKPGYLLPVYDFEAGSSERSSEDLSNFSLAFANRIKEVKGIMPLCYVNQSYALYVQPTVTVMDNWVARWNRQTDPGYVWTSVNPQTEEPAPVPSTQNVYGVWNPNYPTVPLQQPWVGKQPWKFWQYTSRGRVPGIGNNAVNVDLDVANGGVEWVRDYLIPALWTKDAGGDWSTISNWNSDADPSGLGPAARLPGPIDTIILQRDNANPVISMTTGTHNIRKLFTYEPLNITGGSLTINYVPNADSTPMSAVFSSPVTLGGTGALSVHTLYVDPAKTFSVNAGSLTFNTIDLKPDASNPAQINLGGDVSITPLSNATAVINSTPAAGQVAGRMDLQGGTRNITVANGTADVDLHVNVSMSNGQLTKSGLGTMLLGQSNTFSGFVTLNDGILRVASPAQLSGATRVIANMTPTALGSAGAGHGGTIQIAGSGDFNIPLTLNGGGLNGISTTAPGSTGAIDALSGTSTWSGAITLAGTGMNGTDSTINQVSAASGATLVLSGAIQDAFSIASTLAKSGNGDVVLTGSAPNTYGNLTRVYGGRLIIEKDQALGAAGSAITVTGNTYQLGNSNSVIAFRAPAGSTGFAYNTYEWINIDGNGQASAGLGQVDNLGGNNTFAGHLGLNGPTVSGVIQSTIGVSAGSLELTGGLYTRGASGTRNIKKIGAGTLILSGNSGLSATNSLNGNLTSSTFNVTAGAVLLKGTSSSSANIPGVTTWNVAGALGLAKTGAAGTATINLAGGTLQTTATLTAANPIVLGAGGATFDAQSGTATFTGDLTGSTALLKTGPGKTLLSGSIAGFNAPLAVSQGALVIPQGGSKTLRLKSLTISPGAALDLNDHDLVVDYSGPSVFQSIYDYVMNGYSQDPDATKTGLISSAGQNTAGTTILAVWDNAVGGATDYPFGSGQTVDATTILGKYTYMGDYDLNGMVTPDDYAAIDSNLGRTVTPGAGWLWGDGNFDNQITPDDYLSIDSNLGRGEGSPLSAAGVAAVPEPAALMMLLPILPQLFRRRRKPRAAPAPMC
ncbi:MAG TPA: GH25 family lysozyme [Tepidisphaeraceae bacterium]|jgi:autotransporter-associated beta strand protein